MEDNPDTVLLHGDAVSIAQELQPVLDDVLLSKFGCTIEINGVGQSTVSPFVPQQRCSVQLAKGLTVSVWKADLTCFSVDAVVNAANTKLEHYGGLAYALSTAGGPAIQRESRDYIRMNGPLQTGDAVIASPGKLPCKKIIHVVGPALPRNPTQSDIHQAKPLLQKAIMNSLKEVEQNQLQSIAIPAVSSGLFYFPLPKCAEIIVETVKEYHDLKYSPHMPLEIKLVNNDEPTVQEMERAFQKILGIKPQSTSYASAARTHGKSPANTSTPTAQLGNVRLTLRKGSIEDQKTEVIVNTISPSLDLAEGLISKAIFYKAGTRMQDCIFRKVTQRWANFGAVIETPGFDLQINAVYHTVCAGRRQPHAAEILRQVILDCLNKAENDRRQSIAFPAIGTGNLGFDKREVAKIMMDQVSRFARSCRRQMDIHFVIYYKDNETWQAFENQMESLGDKDDKVGTPQGFGQASALADRRASPHIKLSAKFDENVHEAKHWLEKLLCNSSGCIIVKNNLIQYFGQQEFQQLSLKTIPGVFIEEFFHKGCAGMMVKSTSLRDLAVVGLELELILSAVQKEFVKEEAQALSSKRKSPMKVSDTLKEVDKNSPEYFKKQDLLKNCGLGMVRLLKMGNTALEEMFGLKKQQLKSSVSPKVLYQRIPAQFCSLLNHIGFQREYAPPDDPQYGEGIYFCGSVDQAMKVWSSLAEDDQYVYIVETSVLTGRDTHGSRGLIVPPARSGDPLARYDSVKGGVDTHVIFNGYQALPKYLFVCRKV